MNLRAIGLSGLVMGLLFKNLHWPGANIILLVSALLTVVTLAFLLARERGPWVIQIRRPVICFASLTVIFTGAFFKSMHWPGANILLLLGMTACAAWILSTPARSGLREQGN